MSVQGMDDDRVVRRSLSRRESPGSRFRWIALAVATPVCLLIGYGVLTNYEQGQADRERVHSAVAQFQQVPTGMPAQRPSEDGMLQVVYELRVNTAQVATQLYNHRVALAKLKMETVLWPMNLISAADIANGRQRVAAATREQRDMRGDVRAYMAADGRAFDHLDAAGQATAHNAFDPFASRVYSALDDYIAVEGEIYSKTSGVLDFAEAHLGQVSEVAGHLEMPAPLLSEYTRMNTEIALLGTREREVRYRLEQLQAEARADLNHWEVETR